MNRFTLHFAAFVGSASALALVLVAGISFACQSARVGQGSEKGSEMRFTPASRPQDGLSQAVKTPRLTGGKPADLRPATGEVAAGSPGSAREARRQDTAHPVVGISASTGGASVPHAQGVRSVPGRAVPNEVVLLRDARGHFSQAFRGGAETERSLVNHEGGLLRRVQPSSPARTGVQGRTAKHMDLRPRHLETLAKAAALLCGVDPAFYWSIALRESSGRHWDASGRVLRSKSGAWGLGQIKIATARDVDPRLDIMRPFDNALASACYFRQMLERAKGNRRQALVFYHRGPNAKGPTPQASHDYATDIIEASN